MFINKHRDHETSKTLNFHSSQKNINYFMNFLCFFNWTNSFLPVPRLSLLHRLVNTLTSKLVADPQ